MNEYLKHVLISYFFVFKLSWDWDWDWDWDGIGFHILTLDGIGTENFVNSML
jgi:hypothetical protein